ncbi:MAG TPA: methylated-DNA--[protein]-cysteine S-methyltransferase [Gaiellales bacterium]|jgi:O-6-methylguanine DNA methyltransferase|nr:methylated-DNA--[protein]-cysteine S-methyltransferase [Gaiellales bacterium]
MAAATLSSRLTQLTYGVGRWGTGELVLRGGRPVYHELPWTGRAPSRERHIDAEDIADRRPANAAERYVKAFARYLGGRRVNFDPASFGLGELCDEMGMTELERSIAFALARVRWGERVSYGELAARAGRPGAPRAAGAFCSSRCEIELLLPAHRVVRSDGSLGEYGSRGIGYKARLLALEGWT